jgi:hypothetical protein
VVNSPVFMALSRFGGNGGCDVSSKYGRDGADRGSGGQGGQELQKHSCERSIISNWMRGSTGQYSYSAYSKYAWQISHKFNRMSNAGIRK